MMRRVLDLTSPGWLIVAALSVLLAIGLASIAVTDTHYASGHDGPRNAAKQCIFVFFSVVAAGFVLRIGYQEIAKHAYLIFVLSLLTLVPLLVARLLQSGFGGLTAPRNGAYRWINLPGFQLQPSEFMKVAFLIALAWYLRYRRNYRRFGGLMLPFVISAIPLALILLEPDLGTALLLIPVLFIMLFMAGARLRHLAIMGLIGVAAVPFAWERLKDYQRLRVTAVLLQSEDLRQAVIERPEKYGWLAKRRQAVEWAGSSGFQLVHSKNAIGSGGLFGTGWGRGTYVNNTLLPDRHNDFILSIIGHQWGAVGCLLVLACFAVIVVAGVRIASVTTDPFARLLAVGVVALISTQVIINVGMALGLLPITGMTLPFVSYGGSSLLSNFLAIALLVSVSQHRPFLLANKPFDYQRRRVEKTQLNDYRDGLPSLGSPDRAASAGAESRM